MANDAGTTKPKKLLTVRAIDAMKPEAAPYRVPDARISGLAVRVATNGRRTWDLAYRIKGANVVRRSLGSTEDVSLEVARARAVEITRAARAGRDLLAEEAEEARQKAARVTVAALIDEYVRRRVAGRLRTAAEIESRLKRALASVLAEKAGDIRRRTLRALFDEVADEGHEREAEKRRQVVGAMFRWAVSADYVENDPTAGLRAYDGGTARDRVLSDDEIRNLWGYLADCDIPPNHVDALRLQLLLGARAGEIGGMRAEEIDSTGETWVWNLPASRSKNKSARATPIVGMAREIIARRMNYDLMFGTETGKHLRATHLGNVLNNHRKEIPIEKFTTHDLRRTVATGLIEMGITADLVAAVVGHEAGTKATRTLFRHYVHTDLLDRKATALAAWDARLRAIIDGTAAVPNVVSIRR